MQSFNTDTDTSPPQYVREPKPKHTKMYWAAGAIAIVAVVIFAMTARPPSVPPPEEMAPPATPLIPVTPGTPPVE